MPSETVGNEDYKCMDKGKEKEPFLNIRGRELTLESLGGQAQFRK